MEEIKVGEYVRTIDGFIDKVIIDYKRKCNNPNCNRKHISCEIDYYCEEEIVKHSFNIIDLIETKDYVNGQRVIGVSNISGWIDTTEDVIYKDHIKTIVTHEQMKSIEYEV